MMIKKITPLLLGWLTLTLLLALPLSASEVMQVRKSKKNKESKIKVTLHYQNSNGNAETKKFNLKPNYTTTQIKKIIKKEKLDVDPEKIIFSLNNENKPISEEESLKTLLGNKQRLHLYLKPNPTNPISPLSSSMDLSSSGILVDAPDEIPIQSPEAPKRKGFLDYFGKNKAEKKESKITVTIIHPKKKKNVIYTFAGDQTVGDVQQKIGNKNPFGLDEKTQYDFVLQQQDGQIPYFTQKLHTFKTPKLTLQFNEKAGIKISYKNKLLLIPLNKKETYKNTTINTLLTKLQAQNILPKKILLGGKDLLKYKKKTLKELNITPENILELTFPQIEIYDYTGKHNAPLIIKSLDNAYALSTLRTFIEKKWGYKEFRLTYKPQNNINIEQSITPNNWNTFKREIRQVPAQYKVFVNPQRDIKIRNPKAPKNAQEITIPYYLPKLTPEALHRAINKIKDPNDNKNWIQKTWKYQAYTLSLKGKNYNNPQEAIPLAHPKKEIITLVPYYFLLHIEGSKKAPKPFKTLGPDTTFYDLLQVLLVEQLITSAQAQSNAPIFLKKDKSYTKLSLKTTLGKQGIDTDQAITLFIPFYIKVFYRINGQNTQTQSIHINDPSLTITDIRRKIEQREKHWQNRGYQLIALQNNNEVYLNNPEASLKDVHIHDMTNILLKPYEVIVNDSLQKPQWRTIRTLQPTASQQFFRQKLVEKEIIDNRHFTLPLFICPKGETQFTPVQGKQVSDIFASYKAATIQPYTINMQRKGYTFSFIVDPKKTTLLQLEELLKKRIDNLIRRDIQKKETQIDKLTLTQTPLIESRIPPLHKDHLFIYNNKKLKTKEKLHKLNLPHQTYITVFEPYNFQIIKKGGEIAHIKVKDYAANQPDLLAKTISNAAGFKGQPIILGEIGNEIFPQNLSQMVHTKPLKVSLFAPKLWINSEPLETDKPLKPTTTFATINQMLAKKTKITKRQNQSHQAWFQRNEDTPILLTNPNITLAQLRIQGNDNIRFRYPYQIQLKDQREVPNEAFKVPLTTLHNITPKPTVAHIANTIASLDYNGFDLYLQESRLTDPKQRLDDLGLQENSQITIKDFAFTLTYGGKTQRYVQYDALQPLGALYQALNIPQERKKQGALLKVDENEYIYMPYQHMTNNSNFNPTKKNIKAKYPLASTSLAEAEITHNSEIHVLSHLCQLNLSYQGTPLTKYLPHNTTIKEIKKRIQSQYQTTLFKDKKYTDASITLLPKGSYTPLSPSKTLKEICKNGFSTTLEVQRSYLIGIQSAEKNPLPLPFDPKKGMDPIKERLKNSLRHFFPKHYTQIDHYTLYKNKKKISLQRSLTKNNIKNGDHLTLKGFINIKIQLGNYLLEEFIEVGTPKTKTFGNLMYKYQNNKGFKDLFKKYESWTIQRAQKPQQDLSFDESINQLVDLQNEELFIIKGHSSKIYWILGSLATAASGITSGTFATRGVVKQRQEKQKKIQKKKKTTPKKKKKPTPPSSLTPKKKVKKVQLSLPSSRPKQEP